MRLSHFRNYPRLSLALDKRPVLLVGENGAGKTNLLEAVSLLAPGQGLRGRSYGELACHSGDGSWAVAAEIACGEDRVEIGTGLAAEAANEARARSVRIAGKDRSSGALAEHVSLLWLIPAMDGLFTGPASERRKFLDRLVGALDPKMSGPLARFERAMKQRNRLFQLREGSSALFGGLEQQMAEAAMAIAAARVEAVARLSGLIERTLRLRGDGPFPFALLALDGTLETALGSASATEVEDDYRRVLEEFREHDRAACRALAGPHRSDLIVIHGPKNAPARDCSSGEQKALLIGLILAKAELLKELHGSSALILLDEVAAHLDEIRREALFREILRLDVQAWMTGTEQSLFAPLVPYAQILTVNQGKIIAG